LLQYLSEYLSGTCALLPYLLSSSDTNSPAQSNVRYIVYST
jgi:hypothetical protein